MIDKNLTHNKLTGGENMAENKTNEKTLIRDRFFPSFLLPAL